MIDKIEGVIIKKIGDAYMARFDSPDSAIVAAVQIQQSIKLNNDRREDENKITWHIRIGLNTGNVILKDGDLFGDAVNVASRVESLALVDGVFCTLATCEAVSNSKVQFIKHQSKKLKGKLIIFHQVRQEHLLNVKEIYDSNYIKSNVVSFFKDIKNYFNEASLIVARAGSSTIHESVMAGVPAMYVPIKNSVGNHQYENALVLKNNDAAWLLKEEDIDNGIFIKSISQIINNPNLLKKFSLNNRRLRKPLAAKKLKKLILSLEDKSV